MIASRAARRYVDVVLLTHSAPASHNARHASELANTVSLRVTTPALRVGPCKAAAVVRVRGDE